MADIRPGLQGVTAADDRYVVHELKGPAEIQAVTAHVAVSHAHKTLNVDHRETRFNLRKRPAIRTVHLKPVNPNVILAEIGVAQRAQLGPVPPLVAKAEFVE